mmetsp:Transcript_25553/g.53994  ORF Transcript_25553/g.53994 Transcript_25553/m.53994 type:complete len:228 (+) Transcript_25553:157-840(+)
MLLSARRTCKSAGRWTTWRIGSILAMAFLSPCHQVGALVKGSRILCSIVATDKESLSSSSRLAGRWTTRRSRPLADLFPGTCSGSTPGARSHVMAATPLVSSTASTCLHRASFSPGRLSRDTTQSSGSLTLARSCVSTSSSAMVGCRRPSVRLMHPCITQRRRVMRRKARHLLGRALGGVWSSRWGSLPRPSSVCSHMLCVGVGGSHSSHAAFGRGGGTRSARTCTM